MKSLALPGPSAAVAVVSAAFVIAVAFGVPMISPTAQAASHGDDPNLINVTSQAQLDAIRYDLDGNGVPDNGTSDYAAAFPVSARGCSTAGTNGTSTCAGYELTNDLTLAGASTPIGNYGATFDGNGNAIYGLNIATTTDAEGVGLFATLLPGARVRNLRLDVNIDVTAKVSSTRVAIGVGGLAGSGIAASAVEDVHVTGSLTVDTGMATSTVFFAGGVLGFLSGSAVRVSSAVDVTVESGMQCYAGSLIGYSKSRIENSYATGNATNTCDDPYAGGLVGYAADGATIMASYATGDAMAAGVSDRVAAGGLVGAVSIGGAQMVAASYATGDATATSMSTITTHTANAGGLIGDARDGATIMASYAIGDATAKSTNAAAANAGGLVGSATATTTIAASYSTGRPRAATSGTPGAGGLVGKGTGTVTNSYWDVDSSGIATSSQGTGKTASALQAPTGYTGIFSAWNVDLDGGTGNDNPWHFGGDWQYPVLRHGGLDVKAQRPQITLALSSPSTSRGDTVTVHATLDRAANLDTVVDLTVSSGTLSASSLTIPAGSTAGGPVTINIGGTSDLTVSGAVRQGGSGANNPDPVTLTGVRVTGLLVQTKETLAVLRWDALDGATSYKVQWLMASRGSPNWARADEQASSDTTATVRRLTPGVDYIFRVGAANLGTWSEPVRAATLDDGDGGPSPFATMTPTPTPTPSPTPIPPTTQVSTSTAASVTAAGGAVTLDFPVGSRSAPYQVNLETSPDPCTYDGAMTDAGFPCVTVKIFDADDMLETGVALDTPATLTFHLTAEQVDGLGGEFLLAKLHEMDGLLLLNRGSASDDWTTVAATLTMNDETGGATLTATISGFSTFTAVVVQAVYDTVQELYAHLLPRPRLTPPTGGPTVPATALLALLLGSAALLAAGYALATRRNNA